jgi:hypothetical protein
MVYRGGGAEDWERSPSTNDEQIGVAYLQLHGSF